jgi:hypothetical protein
MSCNLLELVSATDVVPEPFPHIVVRNPVPDAIANRLIAEWPPDSMVRNGRMSRSNRRLDCDARDILSSTTISPFWKSFIEEQASARFLHHVARVFGPWIRTEYPALAQRLGGGLERARAGVRYIDEHDDHDLLIDARISINTPVTFLPTSVRPAHVDLPTKLFVGLFYLRPDDDRDSRGGDLVLCRLRPGARRAFSRFEVDPRSVEDVRVIPYEKNVLVLFLNTARSIHAVTPRFPTPHTRRFVNVIGELSQPLFDVAGDQQSRLSFLARHYLRQLSAWRSAP